MDATVNASTDEAAIELLLRPARLWSAAEILKGFACVPKLAGIYAWYFDEVPPGVPIADCHRNALNQVLLYIGIAPKKATTAKASTRTVRDRLRDHLTGNSEGSTLRLTLGCLLADKLGIRLRRVGSGRRHTFTNPGEIVLDSWLAAHAHIAFAAVENPWELETRLLSTLSLPLNLSGNAAQPFAAVLSRTRAAAKRDPDLLPVVADNGGSRRPRFDDRSTRIAVADRSSSKGRAGAVLGPIRTLLPRYRVSRLRASPSQARKDLRFWREEEGVEA